MFFKPRRTGGLALALLFLSITACRKNAENAPPPRYAVLRFENLSGDPGLSWLGRAIAESLPVSLAGKLDGPVLAAGSLSRTVPALGPRPTVAPGDSSERAAALAAGANRAISGYIERAGGQIRLAAATEDLSSGKTLRLVSALGPTPLAALDRLAHEFSPRAAPPVTSNETALRLYATALDSAPSASAALLENAVRLDPDFGPAWTTLARLALAAGGRAAALDIVEQARRRKLGSLSEANLDLVAAQVKADPAAELAATRRIAALNPADANLLRSLAEAENTAGQFTAASADWKKLTVQTPGDPAAWNSLGYARSYAGDYPGALAAFHEYERLRPQDANVSDSIGDLDYSFGKFAAAADNYLAAYKKQNDFEQYGDLYKAAWAKFRAGDKPGADALFAQFREKRAKSPDRVVELLAADWLYRTGRAPAAIASLRQLAASGASSETLRIDAFAQLAIWDLLAGDRTQAAKDAAAMGSKLPGASAFLARFAALPSASPAEWQARAEKTIPPTAAGLRLLALGYALVLDGKRDAAIPVWERIAQQSAATDFFPRALYARLAGKPPGRPLLPDPTGVNQFAALAERPLGE